MIHGFLNIDKPQGWTSHDVVGLLRGISRQKRVGHGGTLDPMATGVLPVALGAATRLLEYLVEEGRKAYVAGVLLGVTTNTDDAEGEVQETRPVPELSTAELEAALLPFVGTIMQVPPAFSAIQVGGVRMYELARKGETIELPPRPVRIDRLTLLDWQPPLATVEVICGKGTYIRALARDLGAQLGCGAHLVSLRRTAVGPLTTETAVSVPQLREDKTLLAQALLPLEAAVADWPALTLDPQTTQLVLHGRSVELPLDEQLQRARVHAPDGRLLAVVERRDALWKPVKVFSNLDQ